ncbi:deoxyguanosinetriphosphate triphosphohydrolase family protein [Clostridium sp. HCS.1]|uniref:deoxyguanosinetriphosphate triphosphohydrolase family protein n=1 Tax=Clostridium sp. HCS.1 TaxID=3238594 RepID=UPI003A0FEDD5
MGDKYYFLAIDDNIAKRIKKEKSHTIRNDFQRDRDRIMYSRAFRRLSGKTQVFLAGNDDHARTRLTHTLEVAQIARTIVKELGLNEELTEAIALGHDIGHTPFGHVGERMLNSIMNGCYEIRDFNNPTEILNNVRGFKHNWQAVRVATDLEDTMNLTDYTLWGMLNHSKLNYKKCKMTDKTNRCMFRHEKDKECNVNLEKEEALSFYRNIKAKSVPLYERINDKWSFEGVIVALADEIAQRHHDIEDALEYHIISKEELYYELSKMFSFDEYRENIFTEIEQCKISNGDDFFNVIEEHKKNFESINKPSEDSIDIYKAKDSIDIYKAKFSKFIVNLLTYDAILSIKDKFNKFTKKYNINNKEDFYNIKNSITDYEDIISYSSFISKKDKELGEFLMKRILNSHQAQTMDGVGQHIIKELFKAYIISPQQLPDKTIVKLFNNLYKGNKEHIKLNDLEDNVVGNLRNLVSEYHYNRENNIIDYNYYKVTLLRTVCDYIAGMTDKYAIEQHRKLYNII